MHLSFSLPLALALGAGAALAQHPVDTQPIGPRAEPMLTATNAAPAESVLAAPTAIAGDDLYYAPIRGGADDNGYVYGTWASGPRYKVSFHDGMAFYPVLGARYPHNLPVRWTTTSVRVGDAELLQEGETPRAEASDWRQEYRFARVIESYDVRKDGVEQRFTIPARPAASGALTIRGRVTTELQAAPRGFAHAPVVFAHADGTEIVRYGEAVAIDADGRRQPMQTAWDGSHLELRLDAAWLATARFPLTVDPLLGNVLVSFDTTRSASVPDIARDDNANQLMNTYGRMTSASDYDSYARITASDFSSSTMVWNDVTASWSTRYADVAFVQGASKWLIVVQRDFPGTTGSWIRYHIHDSNDLTLSSQYTSLAGSNGNTLSVPDVGGTISGNNALVVYQSDTGLTNSSTSSIVGHVINVATATAGAAFNLATGANLDSETPSVNQVAAGGTGSWIVVWTELNNGITNDDWDIIVARVTSTGTIAGTNFLGNDAASDHAFQPKVAGRDGRYMVSYGWHPNGAANEVNGWADEIWAHRFDWSDSASAPTKFNNVRVRGQAGSVDFWNGNIAYDNNTDSHWAIAYHSNAWDIFAARVGFNAGVCEAVTVYNTASNAFSAAVTFDDDANVFPIVFASLEAGSQPNPVYGNRLAYPTFSAPTLYGVGCGPAVIGSNANAHSRKPHSGQQFFELTVTSVPNNAAGAFNVGAAPAGVALPFLPGCFSNVAVAVTIPKGAVGTTTTLPLPIPGGIVGDVFFQYVYVDPGFANPIPVRTTRGLQVFIR